MATFKQSQDRNIIKDLNVKGNVIVAKETDSMQVILICLPAESTLGINKFSWSFGYTKLSWYWCSLFQALLPSTTLNKFVCLFICLCSFSPHSTILGRAEKRVSQVLTVPVEDSGNEDLYSYFSDIVAFIGKDQDSFNWTCICLSGWEMTSCYAH